MLQARPTCGDINQECCYDSTEGFCVSGQCRPQGDVLPAPENIGEFPCVCSSIVCVRNIQFCPGDAICDQSGSLPTCGNEGEVWPCPPHCVSVPHVVPCPLLPLARRPPVAARAQCGLLHRDVLSTATQASRGCLGGKAQLTRACFNECTKFQLARPGRCSHSRKAALTLRVHVGCVQACCDGIECDEDVFDENGNFILLLCDQQFFDAETGQSTKCVAQVRSSLPLTDISVRCNTPLT